MLSPFVRERWRRRLRRLQHPAWLGTVRRTAPISDVWGRDRGTPLDRYYIEQFLAAERDAIRGRVLEVKDASYTNRFGVAVERSDILDVDSANPSATIVADLTAADGISNDAFDCFILTQTLQYVYDLAAAVRHTHRILRPGGIVLCTVPSVSRVGEKDVASTFWRFTAASCERLFGEGFPGGEVTVGTRGNVLSAVAFLLGMAHEELSAHELEADDPFFPVLITVRARKTTAQ
jgi:SAM-dependent methyltransferase